ncbi:hypothetical protein [Actinacidiphila glaucinigra]|uniref:Uncharacterized protein n=1 Tax=Actinacidiphila glaucinigra TaxID=235986 RepID=A0A239BBP8_9ACTN|nr:hypothetical protein [Actinacidiphila glaucinigra]SNS05022.1 hypothetical protein SAMN05216252_102509 [Actinacidiphila glaucinigra]
MARRAPVRGGLGALVSTGLEVGPGSTWWTRYGDVQVFGTRTEIDTGWNTFKGIF